jgi:hypothetical protein
VIKMFPSKRLERLLLGEGLAHKTSLFFGLAKNPWELLTL